jgi:hypothetical protein
LSAKRSTVRIGRFGRICSEVCLHLSANTKVADGCWTVTCLKRDTVQFGRFGRLHFGGLFSLGPSQLTPRLRTDADKLRTSETRKSLHRTSWTSRTDHFGRSVIRNLTGHSGLGKRGSPRRMERVGRVQLATPPTTHFTAGRYMDAIWTLTWTLNRLKTLDRTLWTLWTLFSKHFCGRPFPPDRDHRRRGQQNGRSPESAFDAPDALDAFETRSAEHAEHPPLDAKSKAIRKTWNLPTCAKHKRPRGDFRATRPFVGLRC